MRSASKAGNQIASLAYLGCIALLALSVLALAACTIVPDEEEGAEGEEGLDIYFVTDEFDPDAFVADIWDDKVVPYFAEQCLPIADVLAVWNQDQEAAGEQFGYREKEEGSPWNFRVTGTGVIVAVNTESRASTVDVDLEPADGTSDVAIQIGPVIKGTSIRDSLEFISFTDFTNQLEFARLSNAFNAMVNQSVTGELDREALMGKRVTFSGSFTHLQASQDVLITPVILEVEE
ncbi:MAG: DUF2291 domain-containing protein [Desulfovibrio sp.]|nr:MAG: DUF2291 domain-containing protein [Desulfovibrio sp.]